MTRFDSKLIALEQVKYEIQRRGLSDIACKTVIVVLDREQGGKEAAAKADLELLSLFRSKQWGCLCWKAS